MDIKELYHLFLEFPRISTDTRTIVENSLFFALKGPQFNANTFAAKALEAGAAYAVVDEEEWVLNECCIYVPDVLKCLQDLANFHRRQFSIPVIGITGTNGKTTTKELLAAVLSAKYKTHFTKGNLNNHIGVPLTLLQMDASTEIAVIEMGANHPGEIAFLCGIAEPGFGLITNVGKAHLEGFGSFEGVKKTKKELYDDVESRQGLIFIHGDNPQLMEMAKYNSKKISYGSSAGNTITARVLDSHPFLSIAYQGIEIHSRLPGAYNFENIMAAICIGDYFGVDKEAIKKSLEDYTPSLNRSQFLKTEKNEILMDAYNANPTSMLAAVESFSQHAAPNKYCILGDMFELGNYSFSEHQSLIKKMEGMNLGKIILVGKEFYQAKNSDFLFFETTEDLKNELIKNPVHGATVLLKGSRGMKLESLLEYL